MQKLLDTELENHLEYPKYEHNKEKKNKTNSRNGHCKSKNVKTKYGNIEVQTPRDREAIKFIKDNKNIIVAKPVNICC